MQLDIIRNASNPNAIILGDFNLDHAKKYDVTILTNITLDHLMKF